MPLELLAASDIGGVRSPVSHWHAETLRVPNRDVRTELARRGQDRERQKVGCDDDVASCSVGGLAQRAVIPDSPVGCRVLDQCAEHVAGESEFFDRRHTHLNSEGLGARPDHPGRLRVTIVGYQKDPAAPAFSSLAVQHVHGFRTCGRLVEQGGVGDLESGQVHDGGLEVEQRFQAALCDFGLIGRVLGVPPWILKDVALNYAGSDRTRVPHSQVAAPHLVPQRDLPHPGQQRRFRHAVGDSQRPPQSDVGGYGFVHERVERFTPDVIKHLAHVVRLRSQVSGCKIGQMRDGSWHLFPNVDCVVGAVQKRLHVVAIRHSQG